MVQWWPGQFSVVLFGCVLTVLVLLGSSFNNGTPSRPTGLALSLACHPGRVTVEIPPLLIEIFVENSDFSQIDPEYCKLKKAFSGLFNGSRDDCVNQHQFGACTVWHDVLLTT